MFQMIVELKGSLKIAMSHQPWTINQLMQKEELRKQQALEYHAKADQGKLKWCLPRSQNTKRSFIGILARCFTPAIKDNPEDVYKYTSKRKPGGVWS